MAIQVDSPTIKIIAYKNTGINATTGARYRGASSSYAGIDLTPFLGDAGTVRTTKSLDEPCGGLSVSFADKLSDVGADTVHSLIEAMDTIEVRMSRIPTPPDGQPPLIMRGYVSSIRRVETIAPDGTPQRVVVINAQDSGKLFQNFAILPEAQIAFGQTTFLNNFELFAATGIRNNIIPVGDFVTAFVENVMNAAVDKMSAFVGAAIPRFKPVVSVPQGEGDVSGPLLEAFPGGRYWDVLEYVADRPWNELFVREGADGGQPEVVFRPVPHLDQNGATIMPGAEEPQPTIERDVGEIVSLDVTRGDQKVANFYWVPPGTSSLDTQMMASVSAINQLSGGQDGPLFSINHNNSIMALYGIRKMTHDTRLVASQRSSTGPANTSPPATREEDGRHVTEWHIKRAKELKELNLDNSIWETVQMVIKGHEEFEIGRYLRWTRGQTRGQGFTAKGYIYRVDHQFTPLRSGSGAAWLTTLTIERSDGFLKRDYQGSSPWIEEGRRGPYSPSS